MSGFDELLKKKGEWRGTYKLWLDPEKEPEVSESTLRITSELDGLLARVDYDWTAPEEKAAKGLVLLDFDPEQKIYTAAWADSWHQPRIMFCAGEDAEDGVVRVAGTYSAGEGPEWGWRTEIELLEEGLILRAINVWPEGREDLAVEATYK